MTRSVYYIKKIFLTAFIATFLLAFGAALTAAHTLEQYNKIVSDDLLYQSSKNDVQNGITASGGYIIKEHEGMIGVFDQSGELMYKAEVYIKTLPASDRQMLREGIHADSYGDVLEILGDYTA